MIFHWQFLHRLVIASGVQPLPIFIWMIHFALVAFRSYKYTYMQSTTDG